MGQMAEDQLDLARSWKDHVTGTVESDLRYDRGTGSVILTLP